MKLFISADIEGCTGVTLREETHQDQAVYQAFAKRMTEEVRTVCLAALEAGADEIVVKDGHGSATNIDIMRMPKGVRLIRGKSGHPYNMMFGLDESFDGVLYVGYHAWAGSAESPLSHTSTGASNYILLNGQYMSEFMLNSYTAAMEKVPVIFLSGDQGICDAAKKLVPEITTVATKSGEGASTINLDPETALELLHDKTVEAVKKLKDRPDACKVDLPEHFHYEVSYKDLHKAYRMSFYPGVTKVNDRVNAYETDRYMDILVAHSFLVY